MRWTDRDARLVGEGLRAREVKRGERREGEGATDDRGWVRMRVASLIVFLVWAWLLGASAGLWIAGGGK